MTRSVVLIYMLVGSCQYALLMPSIWTYMREPLATPSKPLLGIIIAAYTLVRTVLSPLIGWWSDRCGFRAPFLFSCVTGVAGGVMYGVAGYFGSFPLALGGRCLSGISGASSTLVNAYIARTTPDAKLTGELAFARALSLVGNVIGPALNAAMVPLERLHSTLLSPESAAGWLPAVLNLALGVCFASDTCFVNVGGRSSRQRPLAGRAPLLNADALHPACAAAAGGSSHPNGVVSTATSAGAVAAAPEGAAAAVGASGGGGGGAHAGVDAKAPTRRREYVRVLLQHGGWFNLLIALCIGFQLTALDTSITPIVHSQYAWGTLENSALFGGFAGVALLAVLLTRLLSARVGRRPPAAREVPRAILCLGMLLMGLGYAMSVVLCRGEVVPLWALLAFGAVCISGLVIIGPPSSAIFAATICGEFKGELLGLSDTVGGLGRIAGPTLSTLLLHTGGRSALFISLGSVYVVSLLALPFVFTKLRLPDRESRPAFEDASAVE